ncbi:subclass B3 metallo-beta-lactamase [Chitinophaga sp. SYP-B3965]|uniref:subclass B3 metallo-beta-lactamase n=1 Tax=Chitinophaga sp. SYP-B3965 TaxID=2663120 RepID=UPI001299F361|nr:subclass B3 metallo-beta-lactamase [Chitinophaga sp. SYP-B3965]MRG43482.1 subclass B3 metallo-beta-lactamase [Chitinophaga sp. SYP-B3965]
MLKKLLSITLLLLSSLFSNAQSFPDNWTSDYTPFRIAGNLYYVGTYDLACYLITTPKGHILINTGAPGSVPMIRSHVETLGFKFADIKILLTTHAHIDHVGGMAEVKKLTGAKMMINEKDAEVLADGGKSDYVLGSAFQFEPVKADRLLFDGDTLALGGMHVIMLHHPGHTKGASSFLFTVDSYRVLIANMPSILDDTKLSGMPRYPEVGKDYAYTLDAMKNLKFDLWLSSHASQFKLQEKHKAGDGYSPEVFRDQKGYDAALNELQKAYDKKLGEK